AADKIEAALRQDHGAICELCYRAHIMGHEQDSPTFSARDILHLSEALCLKFRVPDRQDLVDDQNFRLQMRGDREGQSHIHPAAVVLDRRVEKLLHAGEGDDRVEPPADFFAAHSQNGAVDEYVLAAGHFRMKPGADLKETGDPPAQPYPACARFGDATYSGFRSN